VDERYIKMYEEVIDTLNDYDNVFDVFLRLYNICCRNERHFYYAINSVDSAIGDLYMLELEAEQDGKLQEEIHELIVISSYVYKGDRGYSEFKDLFLQNLEKYKSYLVIFLFRFMMHFDRYVGKHVVEDLNDNSKIGGTRECSQLNIKTDDIGELHLSSRAIEYGNCMIGREDRRKGTDFGIVLENFAVVSPFKKDYSVNILSCIDKDVIELAEMIKESVRIAISHVTSEPILDIKCHGNVFNVNGVVDEEKHFKKIIKILRHMEENFMNVVIFPEMLFTSDMVERVQKELLFEYENIKLVILGSVCEKGTNSSIVLSGKGKKLYHQNKMNVFHRKKDFTENGCHENLDLSSHERDLNLLDIMGFGRISNLICVDYIIEDIYDICKKLGVSFYFSPVYTESIALMKAYATKRRNANGSISVLCNVCSKRIRKGKKTTSFMTNPAGVKETELFYDTENCLLENTKNQPKGGKLCKYEICYDCIILDHENNCKHTPIRV